MFAKEENKYFLAEIRGGSTLEHGCVDVASGQGSVHATGQSESDSFLNAGLNLQRHQDQVPDAGKVVEHLPKVVRDITSEPIKELTSN